jgi:hypothetical protein
VKVGVGTASSSLRVNGVLTTSLDVIVETNATLTLNSPLADNVVGRDFIVRNGGKATHTALPSSCDTLAQADSSGYRFRIDVGRDVIVDAGGSIDVSSRGYAGAKGPLAYGKKFYLDTDNDGVNDVTLTLDTGCHAGYLTTITAFYPVSLSYGSMFEPTTHGSGGNKDAVGGGVIIVKCAGDMVVNGIVRAQGMQYQDGYGRAGAGGSVWIDADGEVSGSGEISARGGQIPFDSAASGGRVAIYYGSCSFSGVLSACASPYTSHNRSRFAGSGTVLKKDKNSAFYDVVVDNDQYYRTQNYTANYSSGSAYWAYFVKDDRMASVVTDFPSKDDLDKLDLFKKVRVSIGHLTALNLTQDLKIEDLNVMVNTGCYVRLNYHTLKVLSSDHKDAKGWAGGSVERSTRERGEIIWGAGFAVTVR